MEKVQLINGPKSYSEALGISRTRNVDLEAHMEKVMIRLRNEPNDGTVSSALLFNKYIEFAETPQELAFLAFEAGRFVAELESAHRQIFGNESEWNDTINRLQKKFQKQKSEGV